MRRILATTIAMATAACGSTAPSASRSEASSSAGLAVKQALEALNGGASSSAHATPQDQFVARDVIHDADGTAHVRFDRLHRGLRVIGGDLVVHGAGEATAPKSISHTMRKPVAVASAAKIEGTAALELAERQFDGIGDGEATQEQVVYARNGRMALAWENVILGYKADQTPSELHVIIDASTGETLDRWDGIETAASPGTGNSFFGGTVALTTNSISGGFELRDPSRGGQYTLDMKNRQGGKGAIFTDADNIWGDGTLANRQTVGVDAQYGTAVTWDYYLNVHGRNGIANDGKGAYNRVHYGTAYNNAFWSDSCFCMTYGDGDGTTFNPFDSIDVAGHEMSHGVTSRTAALTYSGESGGLNEATSDIFGTCVEFYANNGSDRPDYLIGEKLYKNNPDGTKALRYMFDPAKDGSSPNCYSSTIGSLDVHYSSGVANHFFYLLAEGSSPTNGQPASPTCNSSTVGGITRAKAEKIWYRALTVYFTSGTNYSGARAATLSAAADLFGAGGADQAAVAAAWSAVGVN